MPQFQEIVSLTPWEFIFQIGNLLVLAWGIKKFLFKPVLAVLKARADEVSKTYADADDAKKAVEEMKQDYEQRLANAKQEAASIVKNATATAASRADEIVELAKDDAAAVRAKAEADIARERKKAESELKNEISSIALSIAGKVVEKEIDSTRHKQLIDDFIDNVG